MRRGEVNTTNGSATLFNEAYHAAYDYVSDYTAFSLLRALRTAGVPIRGGFSEEEAVQRLGCLPQYRPHVRWVLAFLVQQQALTVLAQGNYMEVRPEAWYRPAQAAGLNLNIEPSMRLIDYVISWWPAIVQGKADPLHVMFGSQGSSLWERYFNNGHDLYAVHNQWAAESLADEMPDGRKAKVLEVGVGYGSAARALLAECQLRSQEIDTYLLSDVSPLLAGKAKGMLAADYPRVAIQSRKIDINRIQGVSACSFDFIYAVNVIHCAESVRDTLAMLRELLSEGGCLVVSECVRADYASRLHQEFVFSLLPGFGNVQPWPEAPPCFGFRTAEEWRKLMQAAGFRKAQAEVNAGAQVRGVMIKGWV
ncbi:hypothetical protein AV654_16760 [Paenibacillus elgii]|uniref:Methyltransferase type 12 domain-containing protein n=1 Tax=Paenibacillus elgii TaxID=189691 RepID=A0A163YAM2_9BACL|nr:hypothetical protein AV654_16760 [Paenibacillus elgii]